MRPSRTASGSESHQPNPQQRQLGSLKFLNRIKNASLDKIDADKIESGCNSKDDETMSPTEAFFARPYTLHNQIQAQKASVPRVARGYEHEYRQWRLKEEQQHQPPHVALQDTPPPLVQELLDHVVTESNNLYHSAASALVDIHINLQKELVQATARNEQFLNSVSTNHKRFAKPLSATFVGDEQGVEIQIGEHVASFKNRLHTAEAELAALWSQWEASQKEVDKIVMEEYHGQGDTSNDETEASKALNTSLAAEMETLSSELEDILHRAHEDARVSEKNYSKKIHGIMSALLQRYLLED